MATSAEGDAQEPVEAKGEEQQISIGARVLIKGLQSASQYNGTVGNVESYAPDGRYGVRVNDRESLLMVKSSCLDVLENEDAEAGPAALPADGALWESTSDFEAKQGDVACEGGQELNESGLRGSLYSSAAESSAVEDTEAGASAPRAASGTRQPLSKTLDSSKWDGIQDSGEDGEVSDVSTTSSPAKVTRRPQRNEQPAGAAAFTPALGVAVTIQDLERSRKYNGESGKVVEDLGNGFFCVQLRSGKRIKVRQNNMRAARPDPPPAAAGQSQPEASRAGPAPPAPAVSPAQAGPAGGTAGSPPVTVQVQIQQNGHGGNPGSGNNSTHASPQPSGNAAGQGGGAARTPSGGMQGHGERESVEALLRAFQRPELAAEFGRVFVEGAAVRVVEGAVQRGIRVSAEEARMRQAALELTMALETELASERERAERAAMAEGAGREAQVLAGVDEATAGVRALLWVVDVLKYGHPLATPFRAYSVAPAARGSLGPAELQAVAWVMGAALGGPAALASSPPAAAPPPHGPQGPPPAAARVHIHRSPPSTSAPAHPPPSPGQPHVRVHISPRPAGASPHPQHAPQGRGRGAGGGSPGAGPWGRPRGTELMSPAELQAARALLLQMAPQAGPPREAGETVRALAPLLQSHMFAAAYKGLPQVMETILQQPPRLLALCGVSAGMQQAGTLLQPLHMAAFNGHAHCVRLLLGMRGIDVDAVAGDQDRPLHKACFNGHAEVARLLLEASADPDAVTPLMSERQPCPQHANRNHEHGSGCTVEIRNGLRTPMHYAVFNREKRNLEGRAACVEQLLKRGADPNKGDCWGLTPLHHASYNNFGLVVALLHREPRTELNRQCGDDGKGDTALMKASFKGHLPLVHTLLSERPSSGIDEMDSPGADPNVQSRDAVTALHYAAEQGHPDVVKLLVEAGATQTPDRQGNTPQQLAARHAGSEGWFRAPDGATTHV